MIAIHKICTALAICFVIVSAGCSDEKTVTKRRLTAIADSIDKLPTAKIKLYLYSLNPAGLRKPEGNHPENSDQIFYNYPILGRVEIVSVPEKEKLLKAFAEGVRSSDGSVMGCFEPRHGISVVGDTATNDFVICYECRQVIAHGFGAINYFLTSNSAEPVFDGLLDEYKIEKAK